MPKKIEQQNVFFSPCPWYLKICAMCLSACSRSVTKLDHVFLSWKLFWHREGQALIANQDSQVLANCLSLSTLSANQKIIWVCKAYCYLFFTLDFSRGAPHHQWPLLKADCVGEGRDLAAVLTFSNCGKADPGLALDPAAHVGSAFDSARQL